jgi:peptide/nickel transport system ATP-binding protein
VPKLIEPREGCRFAARCKYADTSCSSASPPLREISPGHKVACFLAEKT